MSETDYKLAMFYIDKIIECLDDIAIKTGHPTFNEYWDN